MLYQQEVVERILGDKMNSLAKLVCKYTKLEPFDNLYIGTCPLHGGKEKEFIVNHKTNTWFCPTCGESGNQIAFIMKVKDYDFDNALKLLAVRARIDLGLIDTDVSTNNAVYYEINRDAARFFHQQLFNNEIAKKYLKDRDLSTDTIIKFRLGYAPYSKRALFDYLTGLGYKKDVLIKSGLVGISVKGEYYDKFRNRIMFPIIDKENRFIGFSGRVLDDSKPKYLNSPATPVFDKKQNLFGFNYAQHSQKDYFIFCEGQMDVIAMQQSGFDNAVASLGTALTKEQVSLISNYTGKVILAYDSDGPGVTAALRAIEMFESVDIDCRVINMNPAKDPDEYIKTFGKDSFIDRIADAENASHFTVRKLKEENDNDISKFYREATELLLKKGAKNAKD